MTIFWKTMTCQFFLKMSLYIWNMWARRKKECHCCFKIPTGFNHCTFNFLNLTLPDHWFLYSDALKRTINCSTAQTFLEQTKTRKQRLQLYISSSDQPLKWVFWEWDSNMSMGYVICLVNRRCIWQSIENEIKLRAYEPLYKRECA